MAKDYKCAICGKCRLKHKRPIINPVLRKYASKITGRSIVENEVICSKCRSTFKRSIKASTCTTQTSTSFEETDESDDDYVNDPNSCKNDILSPKNIHLKICSTHSSHKYCIVCKRKSSNRVKLCVVPLEARTQAFIHKGIFIDSKARCCSSHLQNHNLTQESLFQIQAKYDRSYFNRTDIVTMLQNVRATLLKQTTRLNFDKTSSLSDEDYYNMTGVSKEQFTDIASRLSSLRNSSVRSVEACLGILLVKLRTGLPNTILSTLFCLTKNQIQRSVHSAKNAMMADYVPNHLGFQHIDHETFVNSHNTPLANNLFSNNENSAILVLDGTYIYIQKSSNYKFQRVCYSMHKHRPLVKMMVIVASDGYILNVLGPYRSDGKNNDASITKHILRKNEEDIKHWVQENDVAIVDRGFRDAIEFLAKHGLHVEMPTYLKKGQSQHTTEEANLSRLVTKVRWVVESANGRIKHWRLLDKVLHNHYITSIGDFVRIVCAICNDCRPPLSKHNPDGRQLAQQMLEKSRQNNNIKTMVEEENLMRKRTVYQTVNSFDLTDFPVLTLDDLRELTMGIYQIKQAPLYTREHLAEESGLYELHLVRDKPNLIRCKIQSRHTNSAVHTLWIEYNPDTVTGWYCTCKAGARTVGCCAHIASVIWFLGYQRYSLIKSGPSGGFLSSVMDASDMPLTDSDSDSNTNENVEE